MVHGLETLEQVNGLAIAKSVLEDRDRYWDGYERGYVERGNDILSNPGDWLGWAIICACMTLFGLLVGLSIGVMF